MKMLQSSSVPDTWYQTNVTLENVWLTYDTEIHVEWNDLDLYRDNKTWLGLRWNIILEGNVFRAK